MNKSELLAEFRHCSYTCSVCYLSLIANCRVGLRFPITYDGRFTFYV